MKTFAVIFLFCSLALFGQNELRVVPVKKTPESETVATKIIFPRPYEVKMSSPLNVQLRVEGFPLGVMTEGERAKEIYNSPQGQSIHVILDQEPYQLFTELSEDSFDENRGFYDRMVSFSLSNLSPGMHTLRLFPARSYGESLKGEGTFAAQIFYFQEKDQKEGAEVDLSKPFLTYNEPQGVYHREEPILLDFLLSNCELSENGFKVLLKVDGKEVERLAKSAPFYLYGLSSGKHLIELELLDHEDKVVPGIFNVTKREIEIISTVKNPA